MRVPGIVVVTVHLAAQHFSTQHSRFPLSAHHNIVIKLLILVGAVFWSAFDRVPCSILV